MDISFKNYEASFGKINSISVILSMHNHMWWNNFSLENCLIFMYFAAYSQAVAATESPTSKCRART